MYVFHSVVWSSVPWFFFKRNEMANGFQPEFQPVSRKSPGLPPQSFSVFGFSQGRLFLFFILSHPPPGRMFWVVDDSPFRLTCFHIQMQFPAKENANDRKGKVVDDMMGRPQGHLLHTHKYTQHSDRSYISRHTTGPTNSRSVWRGLVLYFILVSRLRVLHFIMKRLKKNK